MTDRIDHGAHDLAWPGRRAISRDPAPGPGTWEIIDHDGCEGDGFLRAFARHQTLPECPWCGQPVVWQLSHMAASVAADHRGAGRLP